MNLTWLKKVGIHLGVFAAMALGVFLLKDKLPSEPLRLLAALTLGAYAAKPAADWVCRKVL